MAVTNDYMTMGSLTAKRYISIRQLNMKFKEKNVRYYLIILFSTIFMGSSFPSGKFLIYSENIPPFLVFGWRFIFAGLLLLLLCWYKYGYQEIIPQASNSIWKGISLVFCVGCLQTAGTMGMLSLALKTLSSSLSSIVLFTNPLWLAILAHVFLNEKITILKASALILGFLGIVSCLGVEGQFDQRGILFAFVGSFCWALNTLITKKNMFDKSIFVFTGWQLLLGGSVMLFFSYILSENYNYNLIGFWDIFWFVWLIIPASIGSFSLWFMALKIGGATTTSSFLFLVPLFSLVFSIVFLHDAVSFNILIGGLLIMISLYLINKK